MFASPWKDGLIILAIVLLFFGPKRLPALSRSIGESIKEFKGGIAQTLGVGREVRDFGNRPRDSGHRAPLLSTPTRSVQTLRVGINQAP